MVSNADDECGAIDVSVVIVNWNTASDLRNCLSSLYSHVESRTRIETIVVDNASSDGSAETIRSEFPQVLVIQNPVNVGYYPANNQGIQRASGKYILLLNPDCVLLQDCITPLVARLELDDTIGLIACRLLNSDGSTQKSFDFFPYPFQEVNPSFRSRRTAFLRKVNSVIETNSSCVAGVVIGAFQLVPRELLVSLGMLDDSLFMYGEDLDLCYRMTIANKKILFDSSVAVVHLGGRSSDQVWNSTARLTNVRKSIFLIQRKHFGILCALASLTVRMLLSWVRYLLVAAPSKSKEVCAEASSEARANLLTLLAVPTLLQIRPKTASKC